MLDQGSRKKIAKHSADGGDGENGRGERWGLRARTVGEGEEMGINGQEGQNRKGDKDGKRVGKG